MQLAGLASNRGRNLRQLHALRPGGAELAVVLTNVPEAPILDWAADHGVPTETIVQGDDEDRRDHESRIVAALEDYDIELVCLDGYMRVLSETFLDPMPPTLNVHPSLLPSFPGMDAWGDALAAGVAVTGCTVHVVTNAIAEDGRVIEDAIDAGPIVTQEPVPVYAGDDRDSLKDRVLYEGEFRAYPRAVRWFATDAVEVDLDDNLVHVADDIGGAFPIRRVTSDDKVRELRYGENPHQAAALYADPTVDEPTVVAAEQVGGEKGMSHVNYVDAAGALDLILEFEPPAAAVIKHANPAGCATADSLSEAYDRALATDPMSAFGGVVALNRPCDRATAERIVDSVKHVVVAPGYDTGVLDVLGERADMRVLDVSRDGSGAIGPADRTVAVDEKPLVGGRLVQDRDLKGLHDGDLEVVTEREPTDDEIEGMLFGWRVVKHVTSNAIVLADGPETVGIGVGQVSRVDAVHLAARKATDHAEGKSPQGAVMASDAFFPFPDGIEVAADAGVAAVVQPGGSVNDDAVIAACDERDMAMAFTGTRAFRHG